MLAPVVRCRFVGGWCTARAGHWRGERPAGGCGESVGREGGAPG